MPHNSDDLLATVEAFARERDPVALAGQVVRDARRLSGSTMGRLYLLDAAKRHLLLAASQHAAKSRLRDDETRVPLFPAGRRNVSHLAGCCAFSGKPLVLADAYAATGLDLKPLLRFDQLNGERTRALLAMPLADHVDLTIGVLVLANPLDAAGADTVFNAEVLHRVNTFAQHAAVALNSARLIRENARLIEMLEIANARLRSENQTLREQVQTGLQQRVDQAADQARLIGSSAAMRRVLELMAKVSATDATVLIQGETGSGKELVARAVHASSHRRGAAFIAQNCAALPGNLLESELFGYRKGAFTGADRAKRGLFELAHGGTLFLDEIGDMPLDLQAKLLRVLQEGEFRPLGATESVRVDVRLVAATHRDLKAQSQDGRFREDLYYRLCVFPIMLPALRERMEDLPALVTHFVAHASKSFAKEVAGVAPETMEILARHSFPGNVRELRNVIERAVLLAEPGTALLPEHLAHDLVTLEEQTFLRPGTGAEGAPLKERLAAFEARMLRRTLDAHGWNQTRAAEVLQISRRGLIEKMQRYKLRPPGPDALA